MDTMRIEIPPLEDTCSLCGADYENIEHPLKPGVIMMRTCKCKLTIKSFEGGQIIIQSPPVDEEK